jgi:hypothetical protein
MGALILHSSSRLLLDLACNTKWIHKIGAQINLIIDAPFPDPSICLTKVPANHPPPGCPMGASFERVAIFQNLLLHVF